MRTSRFGIAALVLVFAYCAAIVLRAHYRVPVPLNTLRRYPVTDHDVAIARSNLCRLARSERAFFAATSHYADGLELRANDPSLPPSEALRSAPAATSGTGRRRPSAGLHGPLRPAKPGMATR